jgi:hypothetical protein
MLAWLRRSAGSERRLWLFACACCRRVWNLLPEEARRAVAAVDDAAASGGGCDEALLEPALRWAHTYGIHHFHPSKCAILCLLVDWQDQRDDPWEPAEKVSSCAASAVGLASLGLAEVVRPGPAATEEMWAAFRRVDAAMNVGAGEESREQCSLLRCLFRHPSPPPPTIPPPLLTWNGGVIPKLAQAAYDDCTPEGELEPARLAVLGDALEEADADAGLVRHVREPGRVHVRGCHVLDLLLSKS